MRSASFRQVGVVTLAFVLSGCGGASAAQPSGSSSPAGRTAAKPADTRPSAAAKPASGSADVFKLATGNTTPSSMFVWFAQDNGLFARHGVTVDTEGMTGSVQMNAVIAGSAHGTVHTGADLVFTSAAQGAPLKIVATGSEVDDDILVAGPDIKSVEDLKGKKIGAQSPTAGNGQTMRRLLAKYGLQEGKDYTMVYTGSAGSTAGALAAVVSHQIEATAVPPAVARAAVKQGTVHVLVDLAARTDLPIGSSVFALQSSYVQQHPDTVQKIVDSLIDAVREINQNRSAAEAELQNRFKISDQEGLDEEYQRQVEVLAKVPLPRKEDFVDVIAAMPKDVQKLSEAQVEAILEPRFVNDAVSRGLTRY